MVDIRAAEAARPSSIQIAFNTPELNQVEFLHQLYSPLAHAERRLELPGHCLDGARIGGPSHMKSWAPKINRLAKAMFEHAALFNLLLCPNWDLQYFREQQARENNPDFQFGATDQQPRLPSARTVVPGLGSGLTNEQRFAALIAIARISTLAPRAAHPDRLTDAVLEDGELRELDYWEGRVGEECRLRRTRAPTSVAKAKVVLVELALAPYRDELAEVVDDLPDITVSLAGRESAPRAVGASARWAAGRRRAELPARRSQLAQETRSAASKRLPGAEHSAGARLLPAIR